MVTRSKGPSRVGLVRGSVMLAALAGLTLVEGLPATALAQSAPDSRVAIDLSGGFQTSPTSFSQTVTFEQYSETGTLTSTYTIGGRPVFDGGVTVRLWRTFGVGISGSYFHDSGSARVNALVPNPFVFGQPRQVIGAAGVSHTEIGTHLQAAYWAQLRDRVDIVVSGGPSIFRVDQDFVSDVAYTQTFPYDVAVFDSASVVPQRKTVTGGNVGGEVGLRIASHVSLGASFRFSRATAEFPGTSAQRVVVGGGRLGGGVRFLF
jgi:hypothetical protein